MYFLLHFFHPKALHLFLFAYIKIYIHLHLCNIIIHKLIYAIHIYDI